MELLETDVDVVGAWTVVTARGQVDVATAPSLQQVLTRVQVEPGHRVALDLDQVEYVDDLGLGVLLGALRRARAGGGRFAVVSHRPRFHELADDSGLSKILEIAGSVSELATRVAGGRS